MKLHIYAQEVSEDEIWIRGDLESLLGLVNQVFEVIIHQDISRAGYEAGDGAPFDVVVVEKEDFKNSELPYTVEKDNRPGVIGPWVEVGLDDNDQETEHRRKKENT